MAQAIGLQSLAAETKWKLQPRVHSDASAAIGISKRRGLGKIRHLHTERVQLVKVPGVDNPADAFTKDLDQTIMNKALTVMN